MIHPLLLLVHAVLKLVTKGFACQTDQQNALSLSLQHTLYSKCVDNNNYADCSGMLL